MISPKTLTGGERESGVVTAETAVALPILMLVVWLVLAMVRVADAQLSCQDAARAAARAASRGESGQVVVETAQRAAPPRAEISVARDGELVVVDVRTLVGWSGPWDLAAVRVSGHAVGVAELP